MKNLLSFGWDSQKSTKHEDSEELIPARVMTQEKDCYRVVTEAGELDAKIRGRMRHLAESPTELPAVGDWVWVQPRLDEAKASIVEVIERRSALTRKSAGTNDLYGQIIASNVDYVFLVTAMNRELKLRRLERYLGMIAESGAKAVIILNKRDLCQNPGETVALVLSVAGSSPVHCVSAELGDGLEDLELYFSQNETVALVGSSGVGKSTLTNALLGRPQQFVSHIRAGDDRGRHTTTRRDLILRDRGG
ncbi:MAG: GTPase RsgA, partial [Planctomycetota bacterium]|nr:GTPase RsgA [Planctomycetota bacterium]